MQVTVGISPQRALNFGLAVDRLGEDVERQPEISANGAYSTWPSPETDGRNRFHSPRLRDRTFSRSTTGGHGVVVRPGRGSGCVVLGLGREQLVKQEGPQCASQFVHTSARFPGALTPVVGGQDQRGHAEILLEDVRVPAANLLGSEGDGFMIAQGRLGPGRIHHCMRAIGAAERALAMLVDRAKQRVAFGGPLADQGLVQQAVAESRVEIEQTRLLTLKAAWLIDTKGARAAATEISAIKLAAPAMATRVIDRAIQVHGGLGVCDDVPLAKMWGWHRAMRLFDGPDEVHMRSLARAELKRDHWAGPAWLNA